MSVRQLRRSMSPVEFEMWRARERTIDTLISQAKNKDAVRASLRGHRRRGGMGR